MNNPQVYKANALVEASYRLSLYEQRIILACIPQIRRDAPLTDQQLYTVSAQQIADMTGTKLGTAYQNLKAASERLFERRVTLHKPPNGKSRGKVLLTRWVQTVEYREAEGMVALRFGTDMVPYLSQLSEQFTYYALTDVAQMTSAHAIRLYELLCQWRSEGKKEWPVEWLRETLQLEDRYGRFPDFKRWVIEPAVKQINEHSPMWVKWNQRKTGRRVSHLAFTFGEKGSEKPHKPRKRKTKGKVMDRSQNGSQSEFGARFGISEAAITAGRKPGEGYEDAALRILHEKKTQSR